MKSLRVIASGLLLIVLLAAAGGGIWLASSTISHSLGAAPKEVSAAVIGAIGLVGGGTLVAWYQRRGAVAENLRAARAPMYSEFLAFFFDRIFASATGQTELTADEMQHFVMQFTKKAVALSSDAFLRDWSRYRRRLAAQELQTTDFNAPNHLLREFEKVLLTMRKDFGYQNRGVRPGDLLGLWVNDIPLTAGAKPASPDAPGPAVQ